MAQGTVIDFGGGGRGIREEETESRDLSVPSEVLIILHEKPDNSYCYY